jgi:hypothetical protein
VGICAAAARLDRFSSQPTYRSSAALAMSINSSFAFGAYKLFKRESTIDLQPSPDAVIGARYWSYYVALACVLLAGVLLRSSRERGGVDAPFYKASRMKWMFDAETLVRDSYNKVRPYSSLHLLDLLWTRIALSPWAKDINNGTSRLDRLLTRSCHSVL